jgi:hypothetical protein
MSMQKAPWINHLLKIMAEREGLYAHGPKVEINVHTIEINRVASCVAKH